MQNKINVNMSEYEISDDFVILQVIGLGSCIATCLYDRDLKIGGMSHIMAATCKRKDVEINPKRFADQAIDLMVEDMKKKGCKMSSMVAKICGGSNMFPGIVLMTIGKDNIEAVRKKLKELKIPLIAENVGGTKGRSVWFDTTDGSVVVGKIHEETVQI